MRFVRFVTSAGLALALGLALSSQAVAQAKKPPVMAHAPEGKANCLMCHSGKMPNIKGAPADHAGRANETCLLCHGKGAAIQTKDAVPMAHALEGKANCTMCHSGKMPNIKGVPADHAGIDVKNCTLCHAPKK